MFVEMANILGKMPRVQVKGDMENSVPRFCNIAFGLLRKSDLFSREAGEMKCIVTMNAQLIVIANTDRRFMDFANRHYATFDGEIPLRCARRRDRNFASAEKISGSDLIYDFCQYAKENGMRLFLLGGSAQANEISVRLLAERYGIPVAGFSPDFEDYPFSESFLEASRKKIAAFRPDILFVGLGAPKQEFFIDDNADFLQSCGVKFAVGCGGTFDFVSGLLPRAPVFVQRLGLESVFRFFSEISWMRFKRILYSCRFFHYIRHEPDFCNMGRNVV